MRARIHTIQQRACGSIPQLDASISSASASGENVALIRTPCQSPHGSSVVCQHIQCLHIASHLAVKHAHTVVVAPRSKVSAVQRPRQTAHLLVVTVVDGGDVLGHTDVVVDHHCVTTARAEQIVVPCEGTHARLVTPHRTRLLSLRTVPQLHLVATRAYGEIVASVLQPGYRANILSSTTRKQLVDTARRGVPQINRVFKSNSQNVVCSPVEKV